VQQEVGPGSPHRTNTWSPQLRALRECQFERARSLHSSSRGNASSTKQRTVHRATSSCQGYNPNWRRITTCLHLEARSKLLLQASKARNRVADDLLVRFHALERSTEQASHLQVAVSGPVILMGLVLATSENMQLGLIRATRKTALYKAKTESRRASFCWSSQSQDKRIRRARSHLRT